MRLMDVGKENFRARNEAPAQRLATLEETKKEKREGRGGEEETVRTNV